MGHTVAAFWGLLKDISCSIAVLYSGLSAHCGSQRNSKTIHLTATSGSRPWRQISKIASSQTKRQKVVSSPSPHPLTPTSALPREPSLQGPRQNTLHLHPRIFQWSVAQESWSCWFQPELSGQGQQTGACPCHPVATLCQRRSLQQCVGRQNDSLLKKTSHS